jgi:uncharacterized BrkB/YihY/UPF0761 family membrane protein
MWHDDSREWPKDLARATLVGVLYFLVTVGAFGVAGPYSGAPGALLVILALLLGPFAAAWVACYVVPADRRLLVRLAAGAIVGALLYFTVGNLFGHYVPHLSERSEIVLVVGGWILAPSVGALVLS